MKAGARCRFLIVLLAAMLATSMQAQVGDEESGDASVANEQTAQPNTDSLGSQDQRPLLRYGASVVDGYAFPDADSASQNGGDFVLFHPYGEIDAHRGKFRILLSSAPEIGYFSSGLTTLNADGFVDPSFRIGVQVTRRFSLYASTAIEYGAEATRLYGLDSSPCVTACGSGPTTGFEQETPPSAWSTPQAAIVRTGSNNIFDAYGVGVMRWQATRKRSLVAIAERTYASPGDSGSILSARTAVNYDATPLVTVLSYGQVHHYDSVGYDCTSYGVGAGLRERLSRSTTLNVAAGPEFGSSGCGQRLAVYYSGSIQRTLSRRVAMYVAAARDQDAYYLAGSRWVDTVVGGISKKTSASTLIDVHGNYVRSSGGQGPAPAYSGYLISPEFKWRTDRGLSATVSYSHFHRNEAGVADAPPGLNRDWVSLVLTWRPATVKF